MALPTASHGEKLDRLTNEISSAFSVSFFELETIRTTAAEFSADAARLLAAATRDSDGGVHGGAFDAFLVNAAAASASAERAAGSLTARAFQEALIGVSGALREMRKCTIEMTTISSLTKITQAHASDVSERLSAFVESLDLRCRQLQDATSRSSDLVVETQRQSGLVRDELTAIARELRVIADDAGGEAEHLSALERAHHAYMGDVQADTDRLEAEVRAAVGDLIGCLQFPDCFAQRMEHVRAALTAMDDAPVAERGALAAVAAAQLTAMGRSLAEVTATACNALETMSGALERSPLIAGHSAAENPSDAWMTANERANAAMMQAVAQARRQLDAALTLLSALASQIDATQANLEASVQLNREVQISVHNASLVADQAGSGASPLRFLAGSVTNVVGRTSGLIERISEALMHIRGTSGVLAAANLNGDLETLLDLQKAAGLEAESQAGVVERVRSIRRQLVAHAGRLTGASVAAGNALAAAAEHVDAISDMACRIQDAAPALSAGGDTGHGLAWLYAIYTMEDERLIHRETLGLSAPVDSVLDGGDDLDEFVL